MAPNGLSQFVLMCYNSVTGP